MEKLLHFYDSAEVYPRAKEFFAKERARILSVCPKAEVEHVGSSVIPGAITQGDLDIQVRVNKESFESASQALQSLYCSNHPDLWTDEFALFHWKDHPAIPQSIVLTVVGSSFDDFSQMRDLFLENPELVEQYNSLKRKFEGKTYEEYRVAKKEFFGPNGANRFLKQP